MPARKKPNPVSRCCENIFSSIRNQDQFGKPITLNFKS